MLVSSTERAFCKSADFACHAVSRTNPTQPIAKPRSADRGLAIGCVGLVRETAWQAKSADLQNARSVLETSIQPAKAVAAAGLPSPRDGAVRSAADLLTLESIGIAKILPLWPKWQNLGNAN